MGKCQKCNREWSSLAECHCSRCCNHFTRVSVFDRHRTGTGNERTCMEIEEMLADGMRYDQENRIWKGEAMPETAFSADAGEI